MQNAQPTTNCASRILKVDYLSISKQQKNFGVSKMQGGVTIGHMATRLYLFALLPTLRPTFWDLCADYFFLSAPPIFIFNTSHLMFQVFCTKY